MATHEVVRRLNHLIQLHARSLPVYLTDARPSDTEQHPKRMQLLRSIAADHVETVDQLAGEILTREEEVDRGCFPMAFTALNDLSMKFLINRTRQDQERLVLELERAVAALRADRNACRLVEEALGAAKGHLDMLSDAIKAG
jgi:hypothetical protein